MMVVFFSWNGDDRSYLTVSTMEVGQREGATDSPSRCQAGQFHSGLSVNSSSSRQKGSSQGARMRVFSKCRAADCDDRAS